MYITDTSGASLFFKHSYFSPLSVVCLNPVIWNACFPGYSVIKWFHGQIYLKMLCQTKVDCFLDWRTSQRVWHINMILKFERGFLHAKYLPWMWKENPCFPKYLNGLLFHKVCYWQKLFQTFPYLNLYNEKWFKDSQVLYILLGRSNNGIYKGHAKLLKNWDCYFFMEKNSKASWGIKLGTKF